MLHQLREDVKEGIGDSGVGSCFLGQCLESGIEACAGSAWPAEVCRDVRARQDEYLDGALSASTAPISHAASNGDMLRFAVRLDRKYLRRYIRRRRWTAEGEGDYRAFLLTLVPIQGARSPLVSFGAPFARVEYPIQKVRRPTGLPRPCGSQVSQGRGAGQ